MWPIHHVLMAEMLEDGELSVDELGELGDHRRPLRVDDRADSTDV